MALAGTQLAKNKISLNGNGTAYGRAAAYFSKKAILFV